MRGERELRRRLAGYEAGLRHAVAGMYRGSPTLAELAALDLAAALLEARVEELEWALGQVGS